MSGQIQRYMNQSPRPSLTFDEIATRRADGPSSADVRRETQEAPDLQRQRYNRTFDCNARIDSNAVRDFCQLNNGATQLLQRATDQ